MTDNSYRVVINGKLVNFTPDTTYDIEIGVTGVDGNKIPGLAVGIMEDVKKKLIRLNQQDLNPYIP